MSKQSVTGAFCATNGAFGAATRIVAGQRRTFASTAQRNAKHITHFTKTSSPELDKDLNEIRNKIILPSFLTQEQRKKLVRGRYEKKLQADPIIIEIDGETLKFRYMDPIKDIPNTRKSVIGAIKRFESDKDFAILRPLLEGIKQARRKLPEAFYAKIARVIGQKGRVYEIIECARSVKRTGYKLDTSEKVNQILHGVQMNAVNLKWRKNETEQALRWTQMVLDMLEEPDHQPEGDNARVLEGSLPLNRDPQVLLAPLHLAAVLVAKHGAGEETVEKLNKFARDIVRLWPEGKGIKALHPAEAYTGEESPMAYLSDNNRFVDLTAPLLYGLDIAAKTVRDTELASQLKSRAQILDKEIQVARENNPIEGGGRGEAVYQLLNYS